MSKKLWKTNQEDKEKQVHPSPPGGGREKGGGERTEGRSKRIKKGFYGYRGIHEHRKCFRDNPGALLTPHPDPLPQGERGIILTIPIISKGGVIMKGVRLFGIGVLLFSLILSGMEGSLAAEK